MINRYNRGERNRRVAILADICGLYMTGALARCINTVMAAYAVSADTRVVKKCRHPAIRLMAVVTLLT